MALRRLLHIAVLTVFLAGLAGTMCAADKMAARVLADTANGGSTEALVVLAEQADLSPAASMHTKLEKGRFVFNALRAVADRSQAPLRRFLDLRGVTYQSF